MLVLNNWRKHRLDHEHPSARRAKLDPYVSGLAFDGWTCAFAPPPGFAPLPVSPPRTRLLAHAWRRYGPIDPQVVFAVLGDHDTSPNHRAFADVFG